MGARGENEAAFLPPAPLHAGGGDCLCWPAKKDRFMVFPLGLRYVPFRVYAKWTTDEIFKLRRTGALAPLLLPPRGSMPTNHSLRWLNRTAKYGSLARASVRFLPPRPRNGGEGWGEGVHFS